MFVRILLYDSDTDIRVIRYRIVSKLKSELYLTIRRMYPMILCDLHYS